MPSWSSLEFQDSVSMNMMELVILHDYIMIIMMSVIIMITYILLMTLKTKQFYKLFSESTMIETVWSIIPTLILMMLVIPSMKVLYLVEDVKTPHFSFKIIAHQWYWSIVSPLFLNLFMINNKETKTFMTQDMMMETMNKPRLLNCSSSMITPSEPLRLLITSTDVIHSFSIPSLGLKVDALPGRINQLFSNPSMMGTYFGQCSEICGSNHSFMPIKMQVTNINEFNKKMLIKTMETLME